MRISKSFVLGLVVPLSVLTAFGIETVRLSQRDAEEARKRTEFQEYQAELADATPIRRGVLTEKERIHSKFYKHYLALGAGRTISELVARAGGESKIVRTLVFVGLTELLTDPEKPEGFFRELMNASDAVIRGKASKKTSYVTEDDGFVCTEYDVLVTEVFKSNSTGPIKTGATITVTRPGGKVVVDGVIVKATDLAFALLPLNNDVVLFLTYVQETGAYRAARHTGSFEIERGILRPLTEAGFPPGVLRDDESFLQTIRALSNK